MSEIKKLSQRDPKLSAKLRPSNLKQFVGQVDAVRLIEVMCRRGSLSDSILFVGPPGMGKPVAEDTLVLMSTGALRRISKIKEGSRVISGQGRTARVSSVHRQGLLDCVQITARSGRQVKAALDHPFLTLDGWIEAKDLEVGTSLANVTAPRTVATSWASRKAVAASLEAFRLAGYFVGDGSISSGNCVVTNGDEGVLEDIRKCCKSMGFAYYETPNSPSSKNIRISRARPWLRSHKLWGKISKRKVVPRFVFSGQEDQIAHFIGGYFACDGTVSRNWRDRKTERYNIVVEFYSVSKPLLKDVQHLLLRFGIQSALHLKRGRYLDKTHLSWRLTISGEDNAARFRDAIPLFGEKARRFAEYAPHRKSFGSTPLTDPIVEIKAVGLHECYCLTVDMDHTYTVNDFVCHNTTLAKMTTSNKLWTVLGGSLRKVSEVHWQLLAPKDGDVLFVDEIHSARNAAMEAFYTVMEDGVMTSSEWGTTPLKNFQIVAATTEPGKMPAPLRDRFGQVIYLDYYAQDEIEKILKRSSKILKMSIGDRDIEDIANRARGIPRIANRLLRRVKDFNDTVTPSVMEEVWGVLKIDPIGLEPLDKRVMEHLKLSFRPVGISTVARAVGLDKDTLEQMVEPYLIRRGLWQIVPGGRMLTEAGREHLIGQDN